MSNPSGTRFESRLVKYLQSRGFLYVERRARSGAKDKGDISGLIGVVIEAKNVKRLSLAEWADEAEVERVNADATVGVVIFPRRNHPIAKAYVLMRLDQFVTEVLDDRP